MIDFTNCKIDCAAHYGGSDQKRGVVYDGHRYMLKIDKFPNAALEIEKNTKANYREFIQSFCNADCTEALRRVFPCIDLGVVNGIIDSIPELSEIRKIFYKTMLHARYEKILAPAYERAVRLN